MAASSMRPFVECCQGRLVEWNGAFGGQLAKRDPQPGAGRAVVHDGADLQVEQLTDPQAGSTQHLQPDPGERIGQLHDCCHQPRVDVRGQRAWQRPVELGNVGGEHQPTGGCLGPAPGGDVLEGDVAALLGVIELAALVALDQADHGRHLPLAGGAVHVVSASHHLQQ